MNTTFTINLDATELVGALNNLAAALKSGVTPLAVEAAPDHTPEPQKLQEMQDKVIADIRQELAEERTAEAPKAAEVTYTIEQVREAFGNLSKAKGREVAKGILAELGVKSVSSLQPEQFAKAMQMIEEA
nr:MAG TPA: hypothetical protein [Caudoviricetes sp.]